MKFLGIILFSVVAILIKENFCVPAVRPLSQREIIFPVDNWDDCFLDEASLVPGACKTLEECPEILKKWDTENVYPKTCYFFKKQQFVCCPIAAIEEFPASTEQLENMLNKDATIPTDRLDEIILDIFKTEPGIVASEPEYKDGSTTAIIPSNVFLDKVKNKTATTTTTTSTKRPSNIFLDKVKNKTATTTTTSTKRPSNIFLDKVKNKTTTTSTKRPINMFLDNKTPLFDIFTIDKSSIGKRRSETECDIQNQQTSDHIQTSEFPFMTVLGWQSEIDGKVWYPCSGILISPRFVLTAAHCAEIAGVKPEFVYLGDRNLTVYAEDSIRIKQFIKHPNYNETVINNDIALVELEEEVTDIVACLWTQHDLPIAKLLALAYGEISFENGSSNKLFKADLTLVENADCQEIYKHEGKLQHVKIMDTHLCAGDEEHFRHFCQGDTGGPLIVKLGNVVYVVGITSFSLGCADLPPSVFTRVSSFIDWIEPIVWPEIDVRIDLF